MKTAIKFTRANRQPIYERGDYPPVGEWSESRRPALGESGWHVSNDHSICDSLNVEMWVVEVDGEYVQGEWATAYERIRFVRKVESWDPAEFAKECADRVRDLNNLSARLAARDAAASYDAADAARDAAAYAAAAAADAAYAAAAADAAAAEDARADVDAAAHAERKWQCDRIREIAEV